MKMGPRGCFVVPDMQVQVHWPCGSNLIPRLVCDPEAAEKHMRILIFSNQIWVNSTACVVVDQIWV